MNYVKRKMIGLMASLAFAAVYYSLQGFPMALDAAVCAGFTVAIFASARRKLGKSLFSGPDAKPLALVLLVHILFLGLLVAIVRIGALAEPDLPSWITHPIGSSPGGRPLPSAFRYAQSFMVFVLGFVENWWLTLTKTEEEKKSPGKVLWGKAAWEQHIADRLRLAEHSESNAQNRPRPGSMRLG
jgi:hypothetical protein